MLQLSREERLENARKKLQEFRSAQKRQQPNATQSSGSDGGDMSQLNPVSYLLNSHDNGCVQAPPSGYSINPLQPQSAFVYLPPNDHENTQMPISPPPQNQIDLTNNHETSSTPNEVTTAATEKAGQIRQELGHFLASQIDYAAQRESRSPSEGNAEGSLATYSHYSLPASWNGHTSSTPSASAILIRELQQRNVELAAQLEQRNEREDRSTATVASLRERLHQLQLSSEQERRSLEVATQRELAKARDQVRAHSHTVGALVAEKTELEAKLAHLEKLVEARNQEVEKLTANRNEERARIRQLEDSLQLANSAAAHAEAAKTRALKELEQWRLEAKREKELGKKLEYEARCRAERLVKLEADLRRLTQSNEELNRRLEVTMAFSKGPPKPGTPAATLEESKSAASKVGCSRCETLQTRIHELETSEVHASAEKARLEAQYKAYVADMETLMAGLRTKMENAKTKSEGLQQSLEDLRRKLTIKEGELTEAVSEIEQLKTARALEVANTNKEALIVSQTPTERLPLTETEVKESSFYRDLELTADALRNKVNELTDRLSDKEEELSLAEARVADREAVLATATSERTALSRAMEQNAVLKDQLTHLQNALDIAKQAHKEAESEIAELRSAVSAPTSPEGSTETDATSARSRIAELESEIQSLRGSFATRQQELEEQLAEVRNISASQAEQIAAMEASRAESLSAKDVELEKNLQKIKKLEADLQASRNDHQLRDLSERQAQHIVDLETRFKTTLEAKEKALAEVSTKMAKQEEELRALRENITAEGETKNMEFLKSENERLLSRIEELSKALEAKTENCMSEGESKNLELLKSGNERLSNGVAELISEPEDAKTAKDTLEEEANGMVMMKSERERLLNHISELTTALQEAKTANSTSEEDTKSIESLKSENERLSRRIAELEGARTAKKSGVDVETSTVSQTEYSMLKSEQFIVELRAQLAEAQTTKSELEEQFHNLAKRLEAMETEKTHLESVVAKLEMESSTTVEYVTLFAHRQRLMTQRAKIRDALLNRLVDDRKELRQRVQSLADRAASLVSSSSSSPVTPSQMAEFEKSLEEFLSNMDTSGSTEVAEEPDIATEASEIDGGGVGEEEGASLDEQLRQYISAVHDCPNCESCSGSLMII